MLTGPTVIKTGGTGAVSFGLNTLALGSEVSFVGTSGPPDFDPATGIRRSVGSLYCLNYTNGDPGSVNLVLDTLRYDVGSELLVPAANPFCFGNF